MTKHKTNLQWAFCRITIQCSSKSQGRENQGKTERLMVRGDQGAMKTNAMFTAVENKGQRANMVVKTKLRVRQTR